MIVFSDPNYKTTIPYSQKRFNVNAGEFIVTDEQELLLECTLGSCVAVLLHDPVAGVGGMNHISLPKSKNVQHEGFLYGSSLMEKLINESLNLGATKQNMIFKVFGGAKIIDSPTDIGWQNIGFVFDFLQTEGYYIDKYDIGDVLPRVVKATPGDGNVMMKKLAPEAHKTIDRASAFQNNTDNRVEFFK